MDAVNEKIHKLLKEKKISEAEATKLMQPTGASRFQTRKKTKPSLFHSVWLGLLFIILAVVYTHVFKSNSHIDLEKSLVEITLLTGTQGGRSPEIKFPKIVNVSVSLIQSDLFKQDLLDRVESYKVEFSGYLNSQFKQGPLKLSKFTLWFYIDPQGHVDQFFIKDSGGRKLSINNELYSRIKDWKFSGHQIQKSFTSILPVEFR